MEPGVRPNAILEKRHVLGVMPKLRAVVSWLAMAAERIEERGSLEMVDDEVGVVKMVLTLTGQ
jgi:hypothetical protein